MPTKIKNNGFTLIELIAFIVVISIVIVAVGNVFQYSVVRINDPLVNSQLLTMAQSQLEETLSRKFNENTPTGGVPACDTTVNGVTISCAAIGLDVGESLTDSNSFDDVDDFHRYIDIPQAGFSRQVQVVSAGSDFGVLDAQAKHISVTVTAPQGQSVTLSVYRFNF